MAAALRSTGYAFLPVLIVMVLSQRRRLAGRTAAIMIAATLPLLTLAAVERLAARALHGDHLVSLMGRHLFAKAALIDVPPSAPYYNWDREQLRHELEVSFAPIRRFIERAPRETRAVLTLYYETCLQGPCLVELGEARPGSEDPVLAGALAEMARARIARAPLNFLALTAADYASLWMAYKQHHPGVAPALNALFTSTVPFEREAFRIRGGEVPVFQPYETVLWQGQGSDKGGFG